ncbi:uncharacterized protein G2W53_028949 [Senna tora]|uniref:Uncharacterized protein n=1 Tax=Senna tora TaxID=362788 RepID=A0A834T4Y4_9FABA|nr:uncharacterized protein G2W53_028949 [Senna tora]
MTLHESRWKFKYSPQRRHKNELSVRLKEGIKAVMSLVKVIGDWYTRQVGVPNAEINRA